MTTKTTRRKATPSQEPTTLREQLLQRIGDNEAYAEAARECDRIMIDLVGTESKVDQELAAACDGNELVEKIERGEALSAEDSADKIRILKQQLAAYAVAHNRAEGNRKAVLKSITSEMAAPLAADHREKCQAILDAMTELCRLVETLDEIPKTLRSVQLQPGNEFPTFHLGSLQQLAPKLNHYRIAYADFLNGK